MDEDQLKQQAILTTIEGLCMDLRRIQDRAGTMVAVIATILGIGLPLIAQPQTKQYFHVLPFIFLIIAFIFFYLAFTRGTTSMAPKHMTITNRAGQKRQVAIYERYKPNRLEKIISFNYSHKLEVPTNICARLQKQILWRFSTTKLGHAFFLSSMALEALEVRYPSHTEQGTIFHVLFGVLVLFFVRVLFLFNSTGEQTI